MTQREEFLELILSNRNNVEILERTSDLPDCWLVSGALFQTVWNVLSDREPTYGIKDYDLFYFDDTDTSYEAEDVVIKNVEKRCRDLGVEVEVRNQARVHLWYPEKFGTDYPALRSSCDAIDRFLATTCMLGVQKNDHGYEVYAPLGYDDLFSQIVRGNHSDNFSEDALSKKFESWKVSWPEISWSTV